MAVTVNGLTGLTFNNGSTQDVGGVGTGSQTWQNVSASRATGTTYTNTTGKPILVSVFGSSVTNSGFYLIVDGVTVSWTGWFSLAGGQVTGTTTAVVPNGSTYSVSGWVSGSLYAGWSELR